MYSWYTKYLYVLAKFADQIQGEYGIQTYAEQVKFYFQHTLYFSEGEKTHHLAYI